MIVALSEVGEYICNCHIFNRKMVSFLGQNNFFLYFEPQSMFMHKLKWLHHKCNHWYVLGVLEDVWGSI